MARRRDPGREERFDVQAAYAAHGPELYHLALRQLSDDGAAQDAVQEVFLRAWRSNSFDPHRASLRTWLFAIARNVITDMARRGAVRPWQQHLTELDESAPYGVNAANHPHHSTHRGLFVIDGLCHPANGDHSPPR